MGISRKLGGELVVLMLETSIPGLEHDEDKALREMLQKLAKVTPKNQLLTAYYDGHRAFKDLGISIPPQLRNSKAALGWPSKAVKALSRKHVFEGFSLNGETDPFGIDELLVRNRFALELPQTITSSYKHACSFMTVTPGDTAAGEPAVLVQARSAEWTTAIWDKRRREISAFLAVIDTETTGAPKEMVLMLPGKVVSLSKAMNGAWAVDRRVVSSKRIFAEMFPYDPQLDRPFGHSRITREVRYLTDVAVRSLVRTETSAEFYTSPQRWAMNVDPDAFDAGRWSAIIGRMLALESDPDGFEPKVGQFPQMSMEPHLSMYRQLAQNFCAATELPQSYVGIYADNPSSAEAMQAAEAQLSDEAEYQWGIFNPALVRIAQDIVMLRDGLEEPPSETWKIGVKHQPARYVSPQAAADFTTKAVASIPKIAETTEALRGLGFSKEAIEDMQADWRRNGASSVLEQIMQARQAQEPSPVPDKAV